MFAPRPADKRKSSAENTGDERSVKQDRSAEISDDTGDFKPRLGNANKVKSDDTLTLGSLGQVSESLLSLFSLARARSAKAKTLIVSGIEPSLTPRLGVPSPVQPPPPTGGTAQQVPATPPALPGAVGANAAGTQVSPVFHNKRSLSCRHRVFLRSYVHSSAQFRQERHRPGQDDGTVAALCCCMDRCRSGVC